MKKILSVVLCAMLVCTAVSAFAECPIDLSGYTTEELTAIRDEADRLITEQGETTEATEETATEETAFTEMKKGDKSEDVKAVQTRLAQLGWLSGTADGDFGNKTEKAVLAFQKAASLTATGIVDEVTYNAIMASDAPEQIVYEKLDYKKVSRDPDMYNGKHYTFSGKVLQVLESGNYCALRVATRRGYDDVVYVNYWRSEGESRILEDDKITVNGTFTGLKSYESVMGATITIPEVDADTIG